MNPLLKGSLKSVTIWAAAIIAVLSEVAPYLTPDALTAMGLHGPTVQRVGLFIAIVMAICRKITTQSLIEKGLPPVLPAPINQGNSDAKATPAPAPAVPTDTH